MGHVTRLTHKFDYFPVQLTPNWKNGFQSKNRNDTPLDPKLVESLESWLVASVVNIRLQRDTTVSIRLARIAINSIAEKIDGLGGMPERRTFIPIVSYRDGSSTPAAKAYNIALDWIAAGIAPSARPDRQIAALDFDVAQNALIHSLDSPESFLRLRASISDQQKFFNMSYEQRQTYLLTVTSKPDPRMASHAKPEHAAYDVLAAAIREIYRCTGRSPHVPSCAKPTSPFVRLLHVAKEALPIGYRRELVSPARRAQRDEKLNGLGTLERFKAKLYHPDCWSY